MSLIQIKNSGEKGNIEKGWINPKNHKQVFFFDISGISHRSRVGSLNFN
jgi:hypothetical protein